MQQTLDIVLSWLGELPSAAGPIAPDTALIDAGILDSIELLNLVGFLEERFGLTLPVDAFVPENFSSPVAIAGLVTRLRATEEA